MLKAFKNFMARRTITASIRNRIMNNFSFGVSSNKIEKLGFKFKDDLSNQIKETIDVLKNSNSNSKR